MALLFIIITILSYALFSKDNLISAFFSQCMDAFTRCTLLHALRLLALRYAQLDVMQHSTKLNVEYFRRCYRMYAKISYLHFHVVETQEAG